MFPYFFSSILDQTPKPLLRTPSSRLWQIQWGRSLTGKLSFDQKLFLENVYETGSQVLNFITHLSPGKMGSRWPWRHSLWPNLAHIPIFLLFPSLSSSSSSSQHYHHHHHHHYYHIFCEIHLKAYSSFPSLMSEWRKYVNQCKIIPFSLFNLYICLKLAYIEPARRKFDVSDFIIYFVINNLHFIISGW